VNNDHDALRLLGIFHFVLAGLFVLFSVLPLLYVAIGTFAIFASSAQNTPPADQQVVALVGGVFIAIGITASLILLAVAACVALAGRYLLQQRKYTYCLVISAVELIFMPFGTILGVFTLVVLLRESVKELFQATG
jgi:hypothetical protein